MIFLLFLTAVKEFFIKAEKIIDFLTFQLDF
jgi:hypothetical protein